MSQLSPLFVTSYVLLWLMVIAESVMLFVLLRQVGHVYLSQVPIAARQGVAVGKRIPGVSMGTSDGERSLLTVVEQSRSTVVLLVSPTCSLCAAAVAAVRRAIADLTWLGAAVLVEGDDLGSYWEVQTWGTVGSMTARAAGKLQVSATPFALVVDETGKVLSKGVVNTSEHLEGLLAPARAVIEPTQENVPSLDVIVRAPV